MSALEDRWRYEVRGGIGGPEHLSPEEKHGHPASRQGTGVTVMWRNEPHRVSPWMRCMCCGWYQDNFYAGDCACGAYNWVNMEPEPPAAPVQSDAAKGTAIQGDRGSTGAERPQSSDAELRPLGRSGSRRLIVDQYPGSTVATVLGGIARGTVIMLVGAAGVGKSTLAAKPGT